MRLALSDQNIFVVEQVVWLPGRLQHLTLGQGPLNISRDLHSVAEAVLFLAASSALLRASSISARRLLT